MSVYQNLFDLVHTHIYGGVSLTSDMNLVCTLIATMGCIFLVSLPFLLVWKIFRLL